LMMGTVCQDASFSMSDDGLHIAVVCDGHGGALHFRSDVGAKFAVMTAVRAIEGFLMNTDACLFAGKPLTKFGVEKELTEEQKASEVYQQMHKLFASILLSWQMSMADHAVENPITEEELKGLPELDQVLYKEGIVHDSAYGTTLLACGCTDDYWFAFQIGDGKVLTLEGEQWDAPIPDDKACHDNITTSMCDRHALSEFRFCFEGNGHFPEAIMLCTDGMEHTFKTTDKLAGFYRDMLGVVRKSSKEKMVKEMKRIFPLFSKMTTGDDISVASVYGDHNPLNLTKVNAEELKKWKLR